MLRASLAMDEQNLIDLFAHAQKLGFSVAAQDARLVFFPEGMPWEHYLILRRDPVTETLGPSSLTLIHQKQPDYPTGHGNFRLKKPVSLEWILDYLKSQSESALQESELCRKRAELNQKIIEANASTDSSVLDNDDQIEPDRTQPSAFFKESPPIPYDEDYSAGDRTPTFEHA